MQRFPTGTITYYPGWRPTLRWAARVLGVYAIAAFCGGLLFVIYTLAFVAPRETHLDLTTPPKINKPDVPLPNIGIKKSPFVAPTKEDEKLNAIVKLLENKNPQAITMYINENKLPEKYPYGFAMYYSDGQKKSVLYYNPEGTGTVLRIPNIYTGDVVIIFDTSLLSVRYIGGLYCMDVLPVKISGKIPHIHDICISHDTDVLNNIQKSDVDLHLEPLANSSEGAAWVLGPTPPKEADNPEDPNYR
jgi:hypothetical protein